MMIIRLLPVLLALSCSSEKGVEYWLEPENQNGDLTFFYASEEYCAMSLKTVREFKQLRQLLDTLYAKIDQSSYGDLTLMPDHKKNDLTELENILSDTGYILHNLYQSMIAGAGGYCGSSDHDLPSLPYRKKDVEEFWSEYKNANSYLKTLTTFNGNIYNILKNYVEDKESVKLMYDQGETDLKELKESNTIDAMILLSSVQIHIVNVKLEAEILIIENVLIGRSKTAI